jgi:hypothetical protein
MQSYNVYNINWNNLAAWLIPKPMRKAVFIILVKTCLYPLVAVHNLFLSFRKSKIYQLTITPQVCYLERLLNDRYDFTERRIYIDDAVWHLPWFVYEEAENKPQWLYKASENKPTWLYMDGEAGVALNDFVVFAPADLSFDPNEMRSLIDGYKLFGTKYTIQLF